MATGRPGRRPDRSAPAPADRPARKDLRRPRATGSNTALPPPGPTSSRGATAQREGSPGAGGLQPQAVTVESDPLGEERRPRRAAMPVRTGGRHGRPPGHRRKRGFLGALQVVAVLACAHRCSYGEGWRIVRIGLVMSIGEAAAIHESDGTATTLSVFGGYRARGVAWSSHAPPSASALCVAAGSGHGSDQDHRSGLAQISLSFLTYGCCRCSELQCRERRIGCGHRAGSGLTNRGRPSRHGAPERAAHRVGGQPGPVGPPALDMPTRPPRSPCDEGVLLTKRVPQGRMHHAGDETP